MIATLTGTLFLKKPGTVILDVRGVGYEVLISAFTFDRLPNKGEEAFLFIHTNVREDAITLYGFSEPEEKQLFLLLNTVSGVGPKLALGILSGITAGDLCEAVSLKDATRLTAISGVGKKTAARICVELQDKIAKFPQVAARGGGEDATVLPAASANVVRDAISALVNLGYPQQTAWQAVKTVRQAAGSNADGLSIENLIREALRVLA